MTIDIPIEFGDEIYAIFYAAEQILEARKRTRKIPLYDLKED